MNLSKKVLFYLCFVLGIFVVASCGNNAQSAAEEATDEAVETVEKTATEAAEAVKEEMGKTGMEYTSAYVCPMHCKGSGSDVAGKCPVCGMDYVMNENAMKGDDSAEGGEHDHDAGDGHNHDAGDGHNH